MNEFVKFPDGVTSPQGFLAAGIHSGIKTEKKDLSLVFSRVPAMAAGVFTTNLVKAAPVLLDMERIRSGRGQAVILNSGSANACTGDQGMHDAKEMAQLAAFHLGIPEELVYVCSTGLIGMPLPMTTIRNGIPELVKRLGRDGAPAAEAIMTTDTFPKAAAVPADVDGHAVLIGGMSKGAGMIHPKLATTLTVLTTDASVRQDLLHSMLRRAAQLSFNRITVDGDQSTNDTILLLANGMSDAPEITGPGRAFDTFERALVDICTALAQMVARDGEGATKFIEITVLGAQSADDAHLAARAIGVSPLVKTAVYGGTPQWGRILAAIGSSGAKIQTNLASVWIGSALLARQGAPAGGANNLQEAKRHLAGQNVKIIVDLGLGKDEATIWTCDLTERYIKENAEVLS